MSHENSTLSTPDRAPSRPSGASALSRVFRAVDRLNYWVGSAWALTILIVTAAVVYEVVMRSAFGEPTIWSNELTVYLSASAYLVAGGYALLCRRHVRIDVRYEDRSARTRRWMDAAAFIFFVAYCLVLIVIGGDMAITSYQQGEGTGTPWNPPIWPVKAAIPISGLLLLIQGIANLVRDLGFAGTAPDSR